jgi:hypothetical protein
MKAIIYASKYENISNNSSSILKVRALAALKIIHTILENPSSLMTTLQQFEDEIEAIPVL